MSFVIRTKAKPILFYDGVGWQPGFPQIYSSLEMVNEDCKNLKKQYSEIGVFSQPSTTLKENQK